MTDTMKTLCPKCQSNNTYFDGVDNACRTCGERWPLGGVKPAAPPTTIIKPEEKVMPEEKTMEENSKKKPCRNCGRKMTIQTDGLCGGCNGAVYRKFEKGTPEYDKALADAKERFTDPNFTRGNNRRKAVKPPDIPDIKIQEADCWESASAFPAEKNISETPTTKQRTEVPVRGTSPLWDACAGMSLVIDKLRAERDLHLTMLEKIDEAIEILQS